jgi:Fanconi anemia group M protein
MFDNSFYCREYQKLITETALFDNTLVCLPTGLGKTLIAAVVMYNYYHWFPQGLVVFMAPTKPLVSQQIEACHDIVGIPEGDTAHLMGAVTPERREQFWREKRVVFCTPQTLDNDLRSRICDPRRIVCLVFDEAHRASGNYAYCGIVKYMEMLGQQYRILALTATPGNDTKAIQKVVYNLKIAKIEVRSEDDEDVAQYTNVKQIEIVRCKRPSAGSASDFTHVKTLFADVLRPLVNHLYAKRCFLSDAVDSITEFVVREGERLAPMIYDYIRGSYFMQDM